MENVKTNVLKNTFDDFLDFEGIQGFVKVVMMIVMPLAAVGTILMLWGTLSSFSNGLEVLGTTLMLGTVLVGLVFLVNLGFLVAEFVSSYRGALNIRKFYNNKKQEGKLEHE